MIRSGDEHQIDTSEVNVGDVIVLEQGDFVPADGLYIRGHQLQVDESNMTGEADPVLKTDKDPVLSRART